MHTKKYLTAFIERLNTYQIIYKVPFSTLYEDWFIEVRELLLEEISDNLLMLPLKKHLQYLQNVRDKIIKNIIYNENATNLEKWTGKDDLKEDEFPFLNNEAIKIILATTINQDGLEYDEKQIAKNMQLDFYTYTAYNEKMNILKHIDNLISTKNSSNQKILGSEDYAYKNENWFKIGLLFATGEMDKLRKDFDGVSTKIAKHLGNEKGYRPYISESLGVKSTISKKSVFSDRKKMEKIILHCEISNIPVIQHFIDSIPIE